MTKLEMYFSDQQQEDFLTKHGWTIEHNEEEQLDHIHGSTFIKRPVRFLPTATKGVFHGSVDFCFELQMKECLLKL